MFVVAGVSRALCSRFTYERKASEVCRKSNGHPLLAKDLGGSPPNFPNLPNWNVWDANTSRDFRRQFKLPSMVLPKDNSSKVAESELDMRNAGSRNKIECAVHSCLSLNFLSTINQVGWNPEYKAAPIINGEQVNSGLDLYIK